MKRTLLALLVSTSAFAQDPTVDSITPNSGADSGGTAIVIKGTNLGTAVACLLPCPPIVTFGDIAVDAVEVSNTELNVTTPAHAAGVVDVTVAVPGRTPVVVEDGFTFLSGSESPYERVLLPIYFPGVVYGTSGTQWATDLSIHSGGANPVSIANRVCGPAEICPPVFPLTYTLEGGKSLHNPQVFFPYQRDNSSLVLYVSKNGADDVSLGLRVADVSRNALNGGTDLPVIRENEFLTRNAQLHNVPLDNRTFRILLRVYDLTYSEATFGVRIYPVSEDPAPAIYGTTLTAKTSTAGSFRAEAAYAELDITQLLYLRLAWPETARIEIDPMTPGSRYWAFVSLTNNETQLVTLVTPQ
jgi:hypothetical protein